MKDVFDKNNAPKDIPVISISWQQVQEALETHFNDKAIIEDKEHPTDEWLEKTITPELVKEIMQESYKNTEYISTDELTDIIHDVIEEKFPTKESE